uniref:Uncharacterized protein n=1 Tax=Melanthalia intermedia TaxID=172989 RepID=A0A345UAI3_9FLOR|nr:hypothetical protein [Melanthalia intermedia]AXI97469.1 hypothetical protein [Melanthalia intermedia]
MFQLYLALIILFLLPLCYLITNSILEIRTQIFILREIKPSKNLKELQENDILCLRTVYFKRKKWLSYISMLEFYINKSQNNEKTVEYHKQIKLCHTYMKLEKFII